MRLGISHAIYAGAIAFSAVAHAALVGTLSQAAQGMERPRPRVVEMTVVQQPPPVEEPPTAPVEAEPEPEPKKKPPPPKKKDLAVPPPPDVPPPSNSDEPAEPESQAPPVFGVTMRSTVSGGSGMKVRVGNTLMKDPDKEFTKPEDVKAYRGPPKKDYVPPSQVSRMAKRIGECRGKYPEAAKRQGLEGAVRLLITIEADGSVSTAKVLKGLGSGLDEAAVAALKRCKFEPAYKDGSAVAIRVPYTYRFELDDF